MLEQARLERSRNLLEQIPTTIREATHDLTGARALIYFILFHPEGDTKEKQMNLLREKADPMVLRELETLLPELSELPPTMRLPLLDLCLPALRQLAPEQWSRFRENIGALRQAGEAVSLFDFCVEKVIFRQLERHFSKPKIRFPLFFRTDDLSKEISLLLSALCHQGDKDPQKAFMGAMSQNNEFGRLLRLYPKEECGIEEISQVIDTIAKAAPRIRQQILESCVFAVAIDQQIAPGERQLLRAVAEAFALPTPSIL